MGFWDKGSDFSVLRGKVVKEIEVRDDSKIVFYTEDGKTYEMYHDQDCYEHVYIESIVGDLADLIDSPILVASKESQDDPTIEYGSGTWTFYKLATRHGYVDIRWHGSSNGYYSEGVSFYEV